jgi:G:T-mismatch repair DNA endonuclease (very short patch repair protein)
MYCSERCICISKDSKFEREVKDYLKHFIQIDQNKLIKLDHRTIFPDIKFNNKIIECYGDYWHCNPIKYDYQYYHSQLRKTAQDIWKYDEEKNNLLEKHGYNVYIIWEKEWKDNPEEIKQKIKNIINENN